MEISWLGERGVLLKGRDIRVAVDPPGSEQPQPGGSIAEIVVTTVGGDNQLRPEAGPQVVARPGEYELRGVSIHGVRTSHGTAFLTEVDEVSVLSLGASVEQLDEETVDALGNVDVLLVSLAGAAAARAQQAAALTAKLRPAVVVPVDYDSEAGAEAVAAFAQEMGVSQVTPQAKLTLAGSSGPAEDTRVVLLEARR